MRKLIVVAALFAALLVVADAHAACGRGRAQRVVGKARGAAGKVINGVRRVLPFGR